MNTEKIFKEKETHTVLRTGNAFLMDGLLRRLAGALKDDTVTLESMFKAARNEVTPLNAIAPQFERRLEVAKAMVDTLETVCKTLSELEDTRTALSLEMAAFGGAAYGHSLEGPPSSEQAEKMIDTKVFNEIFLSKLSARGRQYARVNEKTGRIEISYPVEGEP
jgi:hypothetical protein